jgi:hypothetical protein
MSRQIGLCESMSTTKKEVITPTSVASDLLKNKNRGIIHHEYTSNSRARQRVHVIAIENSKASGKNNKWIYLLRLDISSPTQWIYFLRLSGFIFFGSGYIFSGSVDLT